jgi:hypothetical protein
MAKPQKTKAKKRPKPKDIELLPDAWERFEKGLKQIAKAKPATDKPIK